jgi:dTDP-4-amino-4,6-dideoxygalactose transaminase
VLSSEWITQGPEVAAFEREFAEYVSAPHAVAVSNCTAALHLALRVVGVGRGDEVITVSHSFVATANAICQTGAVPVFVDVDEETGNINPLLIESAMTVKTKAILCVHQLGMPCDLGRIVELGARFGVPVIEDAACAIGSEIQWNGQWEKIGKPHADIACFSFHPRKVITTGDGGMLTTSNPDYARRFRLWRQHSMSMPDTLRHGARQVMFEAYPEVGFNYRMTDLQAAVGREQLKRLTEILAVRRSLAARYTQLLRGIPGLELPMEPEWARTNWQSYCVRLPHDCDQRNVMQHMLDRGVSTKRGVMCSHLEPAYDGTGLSRNGSSLEAGVRIQGMGVILPLFGQMTEADLQHVSDELARAVVAAQRLGQLTSTNE